MIEIICIITSILALIFSVILFVFGKKQEDNNLIFAGIGVLIITIMLLSQLEDIMVFLY